MAPKQHRHYEEPCTDPGSKWLHEPTIGVPTASQIRCPCKSLAKHLASTSYPSNEWRQPSINSSVWWHPSSIPSILNPFHALCYLLHLLSHVQGSYLVCHLFLLMRHMSRDGRVFVCMFSAVSLQECIPCLRYSAHVFTQGMNEQQNRQEPQPLDN